MVGRSLLAAAALGALLSYSGLAMGQSFDAAFDAAFDGVSFDPPSAVDAPDISSDTGGTGFNESDFDFVSRSTAGGISEALIATVADIVEEALGDLADSGLTPEEIDSVVDDLQGIIVLCLDGGTCEPPDEEPPSSSDP